MRQDGPTPDDPFSAKKSQLSPIFVEFIPIRVQSHP